MSDALETVRDERANGRLSPAVAVALEELDARVRRLEDLEENRATAEVAAPEKPKGGK